jgi:plasmid stability protein
MLDYPLVYPMATLYVENVPDDLYDALRQRARQNRSSIAAEVLSLLMENVPTANELSRRKKIFKQLGGLRSSPTLDRGPFPSGEQMQREDRRR